MGHYQKPMVWYRRVKGANEPTVGQRAFIIPIDHPKHEQGLLQNGQTASTSQVVAVYAEGHQFETENTIYCLVPSEVMVEDAKAETQAILARVGAH